MPFSVVGEDLDLGNILLDGGAALAGHLVCDQDWKLFDPELPYRLVLSAEVDGATVQTLRLDDDLSFRSRVPPGKVELVVRDRDLVVGRSTVHAPNELVVFLIESETGSLRLHFEGVPAGGLAILSLQPLVGGRPHGRVIQRSTADAIQGTGWLDGCVVARGILPGEYFLELKVPGAGSASANVTINRAETTDVGPLEVGRASLRVIARNISGAAVPGAAVLVAPLIASGAHREVLHTDAEGKIWLPEVDCGKWRVAALASRADGIVSDTVIDLTPGQSAEVLVWINSGASLGVTTFDDNTPIRDSQVMLHFLEGTHDEGENRFLVATGKSDASGLTTFGGLSAGTYLVVAESELPQWGLVSRAVTVTLEEVHRDIRLTWHSNGQLVRIVSDSRPFSDMSLVRAIGQDFAGKGKIVDRDAGLVSFPTASPLDLIKIRVASTTGSETRGSGGEFIFAQPILSPDSGPIVAPVCSGRLELQIAPGDTYPDLAVDAFPAFVGSALFLHGSRLRWRDVETGAREYFGFPVGADLRILDTTRSGSEPHRVLTTVGIGRLNLRCMK